MIWVMRYVITSFDEVYNNEKVSFNTQIVKILYVDNWQEDITKDPKPQLKGCFFDQLTL